MKNKTLVLLMFFLTTPFFSNDFVPVNTGIFQMQNTGDSSNDLKYEVFVNNFFICIHEVTQKEWEEIMGNNPSVSKSEAFPVNMVNWYDAVLYCNKRSVREGLTPCYKISDSKRSIEYSVPWESTVIKWEKDYTTEDDFILEKEITIDKDETEQEIEFNFDVEKLKDEKEIELEVFGKLLYDECVLSVKHIPLLVRLGGRTL